MSKNNNYKVYVHINKINGKRYYGITKQEVEKRWNYGYGYKDNKHFWNAINKYSWNEGFEHIVIAKGLTEDEAKWLEIELIREHDTTNPKYGYNITKGGDSNPMDSEESRKKLSESLKGRILSEESRKKLSEAKKGKNNPNYGKSLSEEHRKKLSESHKGKVMSEESRKKLSESHKGKTHTEEHRKNISEAMKGKGTTRVYCIELNLYFDTVTEASEYVGCSVQNISKVLGKSNKIAKGYHWLRAEDVEIENSKVS